MDVYQSNGSVCVCARCASIVCASTRCTENIKSVSLAAQSQKSQTTKRAGIRHTICTNDEYVMLVMVECLRVCVHNWCERVRARAPAHIIYSPHQNAKWSFYFQFSYVCTDNCGLRRCRANNTKMPRLFIQSKLLLQLQSVVHIYIYICRANQRF